MVHHGPTCLQGPRSLERSEWQHEAEHQEDTAIRADLVARVRREIAEGIYDTPEKFALAMDRLLNRLEQE